MWLIVLSFMAISCGIWAQTSPTSAPVPVRLTTEQRLYGLSLLWKEAANNFVYFDNVPNLNWDSCYTAYIPQVLAAEDTYTYYRLLTRFLGELRDGHTGIQRMPAGIVQNGIGVRCEVYSGRYLVTNVRRSVLTAIPLYSEVTHIDGKPVAQYVAESVEPYVEASSSYRATACANVLFFGLRGSSVSLTLRTREGKVLNLTRQRLVNADDPWAVTEAWRDRFFHYTDLPGGVALVELSTFDNPAIVDSFKAVLPRLAKARSIILDLRRNGGGSTNTGIEILYHFTNEAKLFGSASRQRVLKSAYHAWASAAGVWTDPPSNAEDSLFVRKWKYGEAWDTINTESVFQNPLVGKAPLAEKPLAILTSTSTGSAAEDFLIAAETSKIGYTIGDYSNGSTGQPTPVQLPGGGSARICSKRDTYPDGRVFVGPGVRPAQLVVPTFDDVVAGRDPVLAAALKYLKTKTSPAK